MTSMEKDCLQCSDTIGWASGPASGHFHWLMSHWSGFIWSNRHIFFDVTLTYHSTDFQIIHDIVGRVVPASSGQINYGTPPTSHLEICRGVLFAVVTVVQQHDSHHRLCATLMMSRMLQIVGIRSSWCHCQPTVSCIIQISSTCLVRPVYKWCV